MLYSVNHNQTTEYRTSAKLSSHRGSKYLHPIWGVLGGWTKVNSTVTILGFCFMVSKPICESIKKKQHSGQWQVHISICVGSYTFTIVFTHNYVNILNTFETFTNMRNFKRLRWWWFLLKENQLPLGLFQIHLTFPLCASIAFGSYLHSYANRIIE